MVGGGLTKGDAVKIYRFVETRFLWLVWFFVPDKHLLPLKNLIYLNERCVVWLVLLGIDSICNPKKGGDKTWNR